MLANTTINHRPSRRSVSRTFPTGSMAHLSSKVPSGGAGKGTSPLEAAAHITQIENGTVLLFGKRDTGKSSLIRELQKIGAGNRSVRDMDLHPDVDGVFKVDYAYVNVRALEDTDSSTDLFSNFSVWILQEKCRVDCIRKVIHPSCFKRLMVVICLDLSEPWTLREQLREWLEFASETLRLLFNELSLEEQEAARSSLEKYLADYRTQIHLLENQACDGKEKEPSEEDLQSTLPTFPQLSVNSGVPIVVCVLKSDYASNLNTRECPGRADCILAHLRNLCLPYGAGLIYCCSKDAISSRNIDIFYKYCCHRLFDFTFNQQAILDTPEAIFIPSGWDTEEKIRDFVKTTVAGGFETPLESLLPLPDNSTQDAAGVDSTRPQTMTEFLESLVLRDESLLQKDKITHGSQSYWQTARQEDGVAANVGGTATGGGRRRQSVAFSDAAEKYPKSSPRRGIALGDEDGGRLRTARKDGGELTSSRGDTESLRLFFQSLLNKKPSTARDARRSEDATSRRAGAPKEVTEAPAV